MPITDAEKEELIAHADETLKERDQTVEVTLELTRSIGAILGGLLALFLLVFVMIAGLRFALWVLW